MSADAGQHGAATPRRALLSVSDKTGLLEFARGLQALGWELLGSGGTRRSLLDAGLPVREVSDYTGFPEIMGGRVKTLHPRVHGGILRRPGLDDAVCAEHGIEAIDLVVVNLYPFEATTADPDVAWPDAIEQIDIGGPALLRAAAKNHESTLVVCDPEDYAGVLEALGQGTVGPARRARLARRAFQHTAAYDAAIAAWLGSRPELSGGTDAAPAAADAPEALPERLLLGLTRQTSLRYGENPHQAAALYAPSGAPPAGWLRARLIQGKALSYNNIADADAAWRTVCLFPEPACAIIKHANPCGVALGSDGLDAYRRAYATDPTSAFGGIIAFNRSLDGTTLEAIIEQQFVEVVMAPEVLEDAIAVAARRKNVRLIEWGWETTDAGLWLKPVSGAWLAQTPDTHSGIDDLRCVTQRAPEPSERIDLVFAWRVATVVKSNAIVYARDGRTLGVGAGQMSRVDSARIGATKAAEAGFDLSGAVLASDAFFPFRDGIDTAARAGVRAIIQPGGSVRDEEVVAAADEHGIAMLFTGVRHFHH